MSGNFIFRPEHDREGFYREGQGWGSRGGNGAAGGRMRRWRVPDRVSAEILAGYRRSKFQRYRIPSRERPVLRSGEGRNLAFALFAGEPVFVIMIEAD